MKIYSKNSFLTLTLIFIIAFFVLLICGSMGLIFWLKSDSGYQFMTQWAKNKPQDSLASQIYYGLYKKYPPQSSNALPQTEEGLIQSREPSYQEENLFTQIQITSDKSLYHSGEKINLNLVIETTQDVESADLYLYGIKDKYNSYSLYEVKKINLTKGQKNFFEQSSDLPYCNSCSGIKEGDYLIYAKLIKDNVLIGQAELKITLKQ